MRAILILVFSLSFARLIASDCFTFENVTKSAAAALGGKKQVMVIILRGDDRPKGDFKQALAFCQEKKMSMAIGSADPELVHNFLDRELAAAGKRRTNGASIVVVGPKQEDARLRSLLEKYGVLFTYSACVDSRKEANQSARPTPGS